MTDADQAGRDESGHAIDGAIDGAIDPAMIPARYLDGVSSRPTPVTIEAVGTALHVRGESVERVVERTVEADALSFSPATAHGPARIGFADGALCEIDDRDAAVALFTRLGHRPAASDRLVSNTRRVLFVVVAFIVVMAAGYVWGIPWIADRVIDRVPQRWDDAMGWKILETLDQRRAFQPSRLSEAEQDALVARFKALKPLPGAPQVRILFRRFGAPNALALPGGLIVVTDEIIKLSHDDDDALATVLAHEMGHVAHRDVLRQIARSTLTSALAAWYFGDVSSTAAVAAGGIGTLTFSRDAEHQADLYAVRMMKANGVSTKPAAALFRRLQDWTPPLRLRPADEIFKDDDTGATAKKTPRFRVPEYLGTHPDTDGRIALFERDGDESPAP